MIAVIYLILSAPAAYAVYRWMQSGGPYDAGSNTSLDILCALVLGLAWPIGIVYYLLGKILA